MDYKTILELKDKVITVITGLGVGSHFEYWGYDAQKIIEKEVWNTVLNAVAPFHPTRKKYYTEKALEQNLALPQFNENEHSVGKTVSSNKLIQLLNYQFKNLG